MRVCDVPYEQNFYWKGERYVQFIKAKTMRASAVCYKHNDPGGQTYDFPAGRVVKPVLKYKAPATRRMMMSDVIKKALEDFSPRARKI